MSHAGAEAQHDEAMTALSADECLARLHVRDVGRIAFEFARQIEIFPVNYGMEGGIIVFRTNPGTKLEGVPQTEVAFEVDSWDAKAGIGWSVVARGRAEDITLNPGRIAEHLRWVPVYPVAPGERWHWLAMKPTTITGRQFHVRARRGERT